LSCLTLPPHLSAMADTESKALAVAKIEPAKRAEVLELATLKAPGVQRHCMGLRGGK
jgi:hypothetical protein